MRKDTIYVVSGYMRSGTSMMMKCLEASGMEACYSTKKDAVLNQKYERDDYKPNPEGFYELGRKDFNDPDFVKAFSGKLIKVLHWRLDKLPKAKYKVVFIKRDPKEIEVSYLKMFQRRPPFVLQKYDELVVETVKKLEEKNIEVDLIDFKDVIKNPESVFSYLQNNNWPLKSIKKAMEAVNRKLYRSKASKIDAVRSKIPNLRIDLPDSLVK